MHEADNAKIIFVCSPDREAVQVGNASTEEFLYSQEVDPTNISLQHTGMISSILKNTVNIRVINMYPYVKKILLDIRDKTNIVFVRDSFVCVDNGVVLCQMKEPVRKKEIAFVKDVMEENKIPILGSIQKGFLEGGDVFLCGDICLIGIGPRSTLQGAFEFVQITGVRCTKLCVIRPYLCDPDMHRIHLDCIFGVVNKDSCVVWEDLLDREKTYPYTRIVDEYQRDDETGRWYKTRSNIHFGRLVYELFSHVIPISTKSQERYGCNILHITEDIVFVQDEESYEKIKEGVYIHFQEVHKMYGGIRCATNVLR